MRRSGSVLFMAASVLLLLMSAAPAHAAFPGQNGKIAFTTVHPQSGPADFDIYVTEQYATEVTPLIADPSFRDTSPAWSPDGRRIAFTRCQGISFTYCQIAVANSDGTGVKGLTSATPPAQAAYPAWSPDGTQIAFRFSTGIWVMNADGTGAHAVSQLQQSPDPAVCWSRDSLPAWSPDGQLIAFRRIETRTDCDTADPGSDPPKIATVDPAATQLNFLGGGEYPDWSPDGQKLAISGVQVMNRDGSGRTALTPGEEPAWAPDGQHLAYQRVLVFEQDLDILVSDLSGNIENNPTGTSLDPDLEASWQPLPYQSSPAPTYDHPRLAGPIRFALVPNFRQTISNSQCTARGGVNSNHGAPLAFSSCNPPGFVPGTIAHMGPQSSSFASYATIYGDTNAANGDQANVTLRALLNDIRTSGGADYPADLTLVTKLRITDRFNGGSQSDPATVADFDYQNAIDCVSTAGPEGATCALDTSADAVTPDTIKENKGTVIQVFRFRVNDSGANGTRGDGDDRTFATQGIYIP